ncbi:hypothetical protein SLEP1_g51921 [Rubroshorea leprosula]|uniref:Reverse transcriptase domain-containing protein n=1 Tax=Rubroshorea leprosula TaxID=152421 RepID=A0AAV5M4S4_9ROSI|nr:hypothetical protein SLEP1_g51921 [Rubroshorea leprosula]
MPNFLSESEHEDSWSLSSGDYGNNQQDVEEDKTQKQRELINGEEDNGRKSCRCRREAKGGAILVDSEVELASDKRSFSAGGINEGYGNSQSLLKDVETVEGVADSIDDGVKTDGIVDSRKDGLHGGGLNSKIDSQIIESEEANKEYVGQGAEHSNWRTGLCLKWPNGKGVARAFVGGSIGDSSIENCNRLLKTQPSRKIAKDLWDFAKQLGVIAENEEVMIKNLEEMENRDRKAKAASSDKKETKMGMIDKRDCRSVWGIDEVDWVAKNAEGMSGGILCVWNPSTLKKKRVLEGEYCIGIEGVWGTEEVPVCIINVYSPCQITNKRALWTELKNMVTGGGSMWCVVGDFNAIRRIEERWGCRSVPTEMREFDCFIQETKLIDLPLAGRKFTWYHSNGNQMSRIDRFLLSEGWLSKWCDTKQWGLTRTVSDHCPIMLKVNKTNWGPKPFKFFDAWLDDQGCRELISEVWNNEKTQGWAGFKLKEKLKATKNALREWSRNFVEQVDAKINSSRVVIEQLDLKGEQGQLTKEEINKRKEALLDIWKNMNTKERMAQQKSRKTWLVNGDANTKFFHNCVKGKWRITEMNSIQIKDSQLVEPTIMKEEIANFFENMFKEENCERPKLEGISFQQITEQENASLVAPFSEDEIKAAMIEEYRLISLIGAVYKIFAKLLANRLKKVLDQVIGKQQMAFISGRQLMDGVVIANEVVDEAKKKKRKSFLFKIDFEKAYDKVCWKFLDYMMQKLGFCATWRRWIMECLRTSQVSVLKGLLEGVEVGSKGFKVSHLQFADDTILFGPTTEQNVWAMKGIMRSFELVSGLKVNFNKSQLLGIAVNEEWLEKMAWVLCCRKGNFPFKYLGVPIGGSHRKLHLWKPLVDVFSKKLSTWKGRFLSLSGKITLINSVLSSLPVFWMSMYRIPSGTILALDKIRRCFLWGGAEKGKKIRWVSWKKVCKEKENGGLGVKNLRKFNLALLGKWWGRVIEEEGRLWKEVISEKYGIGGEHSFNWLREGVGSGSTWWKDIWKDNKISQMGDWCSDKWKWDIKWRRELYSWEEQQVAELYKDIQDAPMEKGKSDLRLWTHSKDGKYSTRSAYKVLTMEPDGEQRHSIHKRTWNPIVPSKIATFSWQLIQDKIPTRGNLLRRGVIQDPAENCWGVFEQHSFLLKIEAVKEGWECIWFAMVWTIWLARNEQIFTGKAQKEGRLFELIQLPRKKDDKWHKIEELIQHRNSRAKYIKKGGYGILEGLSISESRHGRGVDTLFGCRHQKEELGQMCRHGHGVDT